MNIQLIGGSGFIGSYLTDIFNANGHSVTNIDKTEGSNKAARNIIANVCDPEGLANAMKGAPADWVILLAAEHKDDVSPKSLYYDVNVQGTKNVLLAMDQQGIQKIIFTSSVAVYGLNKANPDEKFPADPFNDYGKSKWEAEKVLREWHARDPGKRSLIIIRPTVVFGPRNKGNVYNLLKQIASGRFIMVGNGNNKKSMAYVENITAFINFCIGGSLQGYQVFNYADKPDLSTKELVAQAELSLGKKIVPLKVPYFAGYIGGIMFDVAGKILNRKFSISAVRVKKFCATTQFSADRVLNSGFHAPYSLNEGLDKTISSLGKDV